MSLVVCRSSLLSVLSGVSFGVPFLRRHAPLKNEKHDKKWVKNNMYEILLGQTFCNFH